MAFEGMILNPNEPPVWHPSRINGFDAVDGRDYLVADGKATIDCDLWHHTFLNVTQTDPPVTHMQCSINGVVNSYKIIVSNGRNRLWLQFTKAGTYNVCLDNMPVVIKVTAPLPPEEGYNQV